MPNDPLREWVDDIYGDESQQVTERFPGNTAKGCGELTAAFQRIYLEATGASGNEYSTWSELADQVIEEIRILRDVQREYRERMDIIDGEKP